MRRRRSWLGDDSVRCFEQLEPRQVLATFTWTGGGDGSSWHDPANWVRDGGSNTLPSSSDYVFVNSSSPVTVNAQAYARTLSIPTTTTINVTGGGLSAWQVQNGGTVNESGGVLSVMWFYGSRFIFSGGTVIVNAFVDATVEIASTGSAEFKFKGTSALSGSIASEQTVRVDGGPVSGLTGPAAMLSIAGPVTNAGTVIVDGGTSNGDSATLLVAGTFTNAPGAMVRFTTLAGNHPLQFTGNLVNAGTVEILRPVTFSTTNGVYTNNGMFNVGSDGSLTIAGNSQTFNQNGGTLSGASRLLWSSMTFANNGGSISGGALNLTNCTLNLGDNHAPATYELRGTTTVTGNTAFDDVLNSTSTGTMTASLNFTGNLSHAGRITISSEAGGNVNSALWVNGEIANTPTGVITFAAGAGGTRSFTGNLWNGGTVVIDAYPTTFLTSNGTYTNLGRFEITGHGGLVISGNGQTFNQNGGQIIRAHLMQLTSMSFNFNGGTIDLPLTLTNCNLGLGPDAGEPVTFEVFGTTIVTGNLKLNQTIRSIATETVSARLHFGGATTNNGIIRITSSASQASSLWSGGTFTNGLLGCVYFDAGAGGTRTFTGNLVNTGLISVQTATTFSTSNGSYTNGAGGDLYIDAAGSLTISGQGQGLYLNGGSVNGGDRLFMTSMVFQHNGQTGVSGTPSLTNCSVTFGAGVTGPISLRLYGSTGFTGNLRPGQTLTSIGLSGQGASLNWSGSPTVEGSITITTGSGGTASNLFVGGTMTVEPSGVLTFAQGGGGSRTFTGNLVNNGSVNIQHPTTFSTSSGTYTNNSAFLVASTGTLTITGQSQTFNQNGGFFYADGAATFTSITFNRNGGEVAGILILTNCTIRTPAPSSSGNAELLVRGGSNLLQSSSLPSGVTIRLQGTPTSAAGIILGGNFTNNGTLRFESLGGGNATFSVVSGTFTNAPGGVIEASAFGAATATLNAATTNAGTLRLLPGAALRISGSFTQTASGVFESQASATSAFGSLIATGAVTLGGNLRLSLLGGYMPPSGQTFALVTGSSLSGSFSSVTLTTKTSRIVGLHRTGSTLRVSLDEIGAATPVGPG